MLQAKDRSALKCLRLDHVTLLSDDRLLAVERGDRLYFEARRPHPRGNEVGLLEVGEVERDPDARRLAAHLEDGHGEGGLAAVAHVEGRRVHVVHSPRRVGSDGADDLLRKVEGKDVLRRQSRVVPAARGEVAVEFHGETVGPVDRHAGALAGVLQPDLELLGLVLTPIDYPLNPNSI